MKNANLERELAEAAFSQKFLIYSAIKFYLNHFYPNSQSKKFTELEITGVRYDQVIKAKFTKLKAGDGFDKESDVGRSVN